ncbi:MAG: hypothetical protein KIT61_02685 [Pyrinomonadaceae bacterium]|nr:hypothetical protein [Blastocatellia bacterium]MCW5955462.1 hypothetical protein [Pyrinomonadaceae bacterium]
MKLIIGLVLAAAGLTMSCSVTGEPIEFSKACAIENDGKNFEVKGVIAQQGRSVFCSNTGGRMECGFDLLESTASSNKLRIDIEQGSGSNTVSKLESGYEKEDIKIRDNSGAEVALEKDIVKLTGKISVAPAAPGGQGVCFMQVRKIER